MSNTSHSRPSVRNIPKEPVSLPARGQKRPVPCECLHCRGEQPCPALRACTGGERSRALRAAGWGPPMGLGIVNGLKGEVMGSPESELCKAGGFDGCWWYLEECWKEQMQWVTWAGGGTLVVLVRIVEGNVWKATGAERWNRVRWSVVSVC